MLLPDICFLFRPAHVGLHAVAVLDEVQEMHVIAGILIALMVMEICLVLKEIFTRRRRYMTRIG